SDVTGRSRRRISLLRTGSNEDGMEVLSACQGIAGNLGQRLEVRTESDDRRPRSARDDWKARNHAHRRHPRHRHLLHLAPRLSHGDSSKLRDACRERLDGDCRDRGRVGVARACVALRRVRGGSAAKPAERIVRMKTAIKAVVALIAICVVLVLAHLALIEIGKEVVIVHEPTPEGGTHRSRLWIVDEGAHSWIHPGNANARWWVEHMDANAPVEVERGGTIR